MKEVKKLVEKLRGIQVGDYIRIEYPYRKTPLYAEVLDKCLLSEALGRQVREDRIIYIIFVPSQSLITHVDPKRAIVKLAKRRKK